MRIIRKSNLFLSIVLVLCTAVLGSIVIKRKNADSPEQIVEPGKNITETYAVEAEQHKEDVSNLKSIVISELMPRNESILATKLGSFCDWIELYNSGNEECNIGGCILNDSKNTNGSVLPDVVLKAGEYLLIYCNGSQQDNASGEYMVDFSLSKNGGAVFLFSPGGQLLDSLRYADGINKNISVIHGEETSVFCSTPTPGYENTDSGYESYMEVKDSDSALVINEVALSNTDWCEQNGEFYDWIELKNASESTLMLSDYYLTDDSSNVVQFRLPRIELQPGGLFIVFCSGNVDLGDDKYCHASFSLSAEKGESLYLYSVDGSLKDYVYVSSETPCHGSSGRMEGKSGFYYFTSSTPEEKNGDGYRLIAEMPETDSQQGVFENVVSLSVELKADGEIYYTLDGSVPDSTDNLYYEPIILTETTVVRAVTVIPGKLDSRPLTLSFIINEGNTLPVTSLVCEPDDMFGGGGVYVNGWAEKTCDAEVSFFDEDGSSFTAGCSVKLHGASSRTTWAKKSMKLTFSGRYGGNLEYPLFGENQVSSFHSLILRGGSSELLETIRDEISAEVITDICPYLLPLDTRYSILYINGEYRGIYAWREAYSEEYVAKHLECEADTVEILRAPTYYTELSDLFDYILSHSMADQESYNYVDQRFDLKALAYWMCAESYFNNMDIAGNIRYIRTDTESKWRVVMFDFDYCLTSDNPSWNFVMATDYQLGNICNALMNSSEFKELLLECGSELYKSGFNSSYMTAVLDSMLESLDDETVYRDCIMYGDSMDSWKAYTGLTYSYIKPDRTVAWIRQLQAVTGASAETIAEYFGDYSSNG